MSIIQKYVLWLYSFLLLGGMCQAAENKWKLTIKPEKTALLLGEPLVLEYSIKNIGSIKQAIQMYTSMRPVLVSEDGKSFKENVIIDEKQMGGGTEAPIDLCGTGTVKRLLRLYSFQPKSRDGRGRLPGNACLPSRRNILRQDLLQRFRKSSGRCCDHKRQQSHRRKRSGMEDL